ncbi:MAG TPA: acyl-CoA dehydrogenase family protein [Ilumatobacter sp.]|nr:acyl-CoA dehydrogenase family protein [Ilumatobacter sp.]
MQFALSDEQLLLRDTARSFVAKHCPPALAKEWDETDHFPVDLWNKMAELGWFALPFPVEDGGGGGTPLEICLIAEALAHASLDVAMAYVGTFIPGLVIHRHGTDEQRDRYKAGLLDGAYRIAVAISEPDAGSDAAALRCAAIDRGDHYEVSGQKAWCTGAGLPGALIAAYVRTDPNAPKHRGISLLLIPNDAPGVVIRRTPTLARHLLGTNEVYFDNVRVPKDNLIGPLNGGFKLLMSGLDMEKTVMAAAYTGVAQATMDEMLTYSLQRRQFDRAIGTFQALAHPMADLQTEIDASRLLAYRAAWMISDGQPCTREAAMAKLKCSETYVAAARLGMQVLAGHGFATESVMSFRWRESIVATISGGTSQIQRNAVAKSMGLVTY